MLDCVCNGLVVVPDYSSGWNPSSEWQWTFVTVDTDTGIQGWGEASNIPRNAYLLTNAGVQAVREGLVGENPNDIERLWHKLYRRYTCLGSRGFPSTILSGIDIVLLDIKGKALGKPIYDLLNQPCEGGNENMLEYLLR